MRIWRAIAHLIVWIMSPSIFARGNESSLFGDMRMPRLSTTRLRAQGWVRGGTFGGPASERGLGTAELLGVRPGRSSSQELGRLLVEGSGV